LERYKSQLSLPLLEKENNELMKTFSRLLSFKLDEVALAKVIADSLTKAFENSHYESEEVERFTRYLYKNINSYLFV
jgi:hypothetical protein